MKISRKHAYSKYRSQALCTYSHKEHKELSGLIVSWPYTKWIKLLSAKPITGSPIRSLQTLFAFVTHTGLYHTRPNLVSWLRAYRQYHDLPNLKIRIICTFKIILTQEKKVSTYKRDSDLTRPKWLQWVIIGRILLASTQIYLSIVRTFSPPYSLQRIGFSSL